MPWCRVGDKSLYEPMIFYWRIYVSLNWITRSTLWKNRLRMWFDTSGWHIGVSWWRHQMETFSALLALYVGNLPVTGEFPPQGPVTQSFDVFFHLNKRLSKQSRRRWFKTPSLSLWRHCNVLWARPWCALVVAYAVSCMTHVIYIYYMCVCVCVS